MRGKTTPDTLNEVHFEERASFRAWLDENGRTSPGIWIVFFKKETGTPNISYDDAVEEALCFGWIDSQLRTIDAARYARRFTPRRKGSKWSLLNLERAARMEKAGLMTEAGRVHVLEANREKATRSKSDIPVPDVPPDLEKALRASGNAWDNFVSFPPSARKNYLLWLEAAKRPETRKKRIAEASRMAAENVKHFMK